ncbi:MAG: glycosyltransferase family 2 protein [Muribaculaceae bacterium]|nr:glycosyltransferase family 2 protein [Muribaculaceae bacterium]
MNDSGYYSECMTVVVPVYNRAHLITRCLDSIYAQSYRPLRVVVVDNASTDSTASAVEKWSASHVSEGFTLCLLTENRQGAAYARQRGLDSVDTEKVMFFDSDDAMRPHCVAAVMQEWRHCPQAEIVAWPVTIHHAGGPVETHSIKGNLLERHMVHAVLRTQGHAVKTDLLRACGGWKGEYPVWDDFETGVRLLLGNPKVLPVVGSLADVYPQEESITGTDFSSKAGKWENTLDGIESLLRASGRRDTGRLVGIVNYRRAILAADYAKEGRHDLAGPLYCRALSESTRRQRPLIRFAYHWTRLGMRGAFSIIGKFL